ncbi:MAG TPA: sigma-70 family RNA polymerase sigma factor [Kofleriaceae bacterium]|nr:sigma-70 family RNA polymerase sigma factor [Kofleriaceae bacterium]
MPGQRPSTSANGRANSSSALLPDDHELVLAARKGNRDAFRTLFERYHRRAYALALGVLRHSDDALDVVQDAFVKAHKYLDKFEGNSSFYTWLYRIVMNLAIDHLRKHRRVKPVEFDEARLEEAHSDEGLLPRILGGNPGRALMDKEIRKRIDAALDELSDNHRAVLVMRELEGLSYEEMAQTMGCSKGTIMSRLFHARRNMQKRLIDLLDNPSRELIEDLGLASAEGGEAAADDDGKDGDGKDPKTAGAPTRAVRSER